ncbi:hypothetical protein D3D02_06735 [Halobellus sp. Atlit-38R]|uniref:hypothetical protein n=1 Tax=Halobellus sp. Atlit-38R TaxID=2282131 RepID=UPI000EF23246|nr:hypothetical protein [Halobellus sp. Atlit-38R]RLM89573.1 hypothetical protein D3D02_06735 [Halobellus sp. Atlit-38R]
MIRVIAVGVVGAIATGTGMALYERDALRPVLEALGIVGVPVALGLLIHPFVGLTAALIILEALYEAHQSGILAEREEQLQTLWYRLRADTRRGREQLRQRIDAWLAARGGDQTAADEERESL